MAAKPTECKPKHGPCSKKRKLTKTPCSNDSKECKDEFSVNDSVTNEDLKNPDKISVSCGNCSFSAHTIDAFPLQIFSKGSNSFYCTKKECQEAGMPAKFTSKPRCGLCFRKTRKLIKTECCDNWICNDMHKYVLFSFDMNSCHRNHSCYSQCGYHHSARHEGRWQDCKTCKDEDYGLGYDFSFDVEDYISCANCGISESKIDAFPLQVNFKGSKSYFCSKEECQKAGLPAKPTELKSEPECGLCGKTKKLTKTECCDSWICNDMHKYILFTYDRDSCHRNHWRFSQCGHHHKEGHQGWWKDCKACKDEDLDYDFDFSSDEELKNPE